MIKMDLEFVSTHRNRELWSNPCVFETSWSNSGQASGLNAVDPVSNQTPLISWTSKLINENVSIVSNVDNYVVVSAQVNTLNAFIPNYYRGAIIIDQSGVGSRIESCKFISQSNNLDYFQLTLPRLAPLGNTSTIKVDQIPNTLFVPGGFDLGCNSPKHHRRKR